MSDTTSSRTDGARAPTAECPLIEPGGWRLMLVPLLLVAITIFVRAQSWRWVLAKSNLEVIAPPMLAVALLAWTATWRRTRETAVLWLALLTAVFLCREIHFRGSNTLLYASLAALAVWGVAARRRLLTSVRRLPARAWIAAAFFGYALSQAVARRVFKAIPGEQQVHVPLEELLEDGAHVLLLVAALAAWRAAPRRKPDAVR